MELTVVDRDTGKPVACRMHLFNAAGKPRKPKKVPFYNDHFVVPGKITLKLPVGTYTFRLERGPEYLWREGNFRIENFADDSKQVDLKRFVDMSEHGWYSGDLQVIRPAEDIELLMEADDLHVAEVVTWNERKTLQVKPPTAESVLVRFDKNRYCHLMAGSLHRAGTELLLLNLPEPLTLRGDNDEYPPSIEYIQEAREHDGVWVDLTKPFWWDLPMLVALGQIDSIQVAHSHVARESVECHEGDGRPRDRHRFPAPMGNAQWSHEVYFRLLECGLRIPPSAGSGSGEAPNPVGYNRVYVHVDDPFDYGTWWQNFCAGRVVVTNGPLLRPTVHGQLPGHVFQADEGAKVELEVGLTLSTREPISYLEIIKNGRVEESIRFEDYAKTGKLPKVRFNEGGWFVLRAVTDLPKTYRFAMTAPYFVEIGYQRRISKQAAQFFLDWVYDRARQVAQIPDEQQRTAVLGYHRKARDFWQDLVDRANAE